MSYHSRVNYFAHARAALDRPWRLAGCCLPDWLAACGGPRIRRGARVAKARPRDATDAEIAHGIADHIVDDIAFHGSDAFRDTCATVARALRTARDADPRYRASFAAHVLVELVLDDVLIAATPRGLERFYAASRAIDSTELASRAARLVPGVPRDALVRLHRRFNALAFLGDYADDRTLVARLLDIGKRAGIDLGPAPPLRAILPETRSLVAARADALLPSG